MSEYVFKLPDLGEGTVEAEIVEWHVKPGDAVREGDIIADVMTDKANVEVPAPVTGTVLRTSGTPGDMVAVGAELIAFDLTGDAKLPVSPPAPRPKEVVDEDARSAGEPVTERTKAVPAETPVPVREAASENPRQAKTDSSAGAESEAVGPAAAAGAMPAPGEAPRVRTSPAVRRRAKEAGVDLATVTGTGPGGRILRADLEAVVSGEPGRQAAMVEPTGPGEIEEVRVIGVRRVIANRLQAAKREIPHFAYVEEVDVTRLESLRQKLNDENREGRPRLTYLPFIGLALIRALRNFPQCNAQFDSEAGVIRRFSSVHLGVAAQTPDGLKVPVVHHANRLGLWQLAEQMARVTTAARDNTATRTELTGSSITITSLGALGGIVSTPVINAPEVAIIGVNKAVDRPMVIDGRVEIRRMMNLSSSFDHRFVDGFDGASLIQEVRSYLEEPATIFIAD
jgi:2-oxoisovalerate dehydrogenase E2 component (dihydrolipoyl transacylase)